MSDVGDDIVDETHGSNFQIVTNMEAPQRPHYERCGLGK